MDRHWLITAWYVVALISIIILAKLLSLLLAKKRPEDQLKFFLFAPALSIDTWKRARPLQQNDVRRLLAQTLVVLPTMFAVYLWLPGAISHPRLPWFVRAYCAVVPFWVLTETISLMTQLSFLPAKILIPSWHKQPWRSHTLAEFWGQRWNQLWSDWLRQVCFQPLRNMPGIGLIVAFAVSGGIHELLVNVPLWLVFRTNLFGTMCLYFLMQAGGIFIERIWLRQNAMANRVFLWAVVVGPVPLVLNEGTLRIFQFVS